MSNEDIAPKMGDYEILELLGAGGMGKVFKARNVISDRIEALKIVLPDLAERQDLVQRFLREIKLLASLEHPNIAALHTAFTINNQLVMVMEFVEGATLSAILKKGRIPVMEAVGYIDQTLAALSYAHRRHVTHRDIKPANMMLTHSGVLKLMDFGIARVDDAPGITKTGAGVGSPGYMSPEQIMGKSVDARSDIYSVTISLYEFITGITPFQGDSDFSIMTAQMQDIPTPPIKLQPDLPHVLNEAIVKGLAKDPDHRFQSADDFRTALKNAFRTVSSHGPAADVSTIVDGPAINISVKPASVPGPAADVGTIVDGHAPANVSVKPEPAKIPVESEPSSGPLPETKPTTHRGLYMTLGALAVAAVIAAAVFFYVQRRVPPPTPQDPVAQTAANETSQSGSNLPSGTIVPDAAQTAANETSQSGSGLPSETIAPGALQLTKPQQIITDRSFSDADPDDQAQPAQKPGPINVTAGTSFRVSTISDISTKTGMKGDKFDAVLAEDITSDDRIIAKRNSIVKGVVSKADPGGPAKGAATLSLQITELTLADGRTVSVRTNEYTATGKIDKNAAAIGVEAALNLGSGATGGAPAGMDDISRLAAAQSTPAVVARRTSITFRLASDLKVTLKD